MDETLFYVFGIGLAISAVVFSFIALKAKDSFPGKAFPIIVLWFLVLAGGATTFSVLHAKEEQEHKAKEFEQAGEEIESEEGSQHEEVEPGEAPQEEQAPAGEEKENEEEGEAEEAEAGGEEAEGNEANAMEGESGSAEGAGGEVKLAADESALLYDTDSLESSAGEVKIDFDNPSSIPHDVAVEDEGGAELGETEIIASGEASTTLDLKPGTYTFFCSVPGHREAGMEGTLTVK